MQARYEKQKAEYEKSGGGGEASAPAPKKAKAAPKKPAKKKEEEPEEEDDDDEEVCCASQLSLAAQGPLLQCSQQRPHLMYSSSLPLCNCEGVR